MTPERLRFDLAELAEDVAPADLTARVRRTSRRLGIRRAVASSAAALALFALATGGALALRPDKQSAPILPGGTPTATAPVEQTTGPTPSPTVDPSNTSSEPAAPVIGRVFYGPTSVPYGGGMTRLQSWTPGGAPKKLMSLSIQSLEANAAVSPDGRRVAWVDNDWDGAGLGTLWVANVDGSGKRELRKNADGNCWGPTWAPNGKSITVSLVTSTNPYAEKRGVLDTETGKFTEVRKLQGCHPLWSADGKVLAFPDGSTGRVIMSDPSGAGQWSIPNLGGTNAAYSSLDVASISPDGGKIALKRRSRDQESGDVARELDVNAILDTHTGKEIRLPLDGRSLLQAYFQADGSLVARVRDGQRNTLVLIDADGKKISEVPEPASLKDQQILAVTS